MEWVIDLYNTNKIQKLARLIPLFIFISIILVVIFAWALPSWFADIDLDRQMYLAKAAGVDFITVNLLDWVALWSPLILAAIATAVLVYPRRFMSAIPVQRNNRWMVAVIFSAVVFGISYGIGFLDQEFSYGIFMAQYLQNDGSFVGFLESFSAIMIPFDPSQYNINTLLTWKYLTMPIINTILTACLIREIIEILGTRAAGGYAIAFLGRIFTIIGIIIAYFYVASPLAVYDAIERTWLYILPLTMWTFIGTGIFCRVMTFTEKRASEDVAGGTFLIAVIVVIGMIIAPCIVAAPGFFSREQNWQDIVWNGKVQQQVMQTRNASDLLGIQYTSVSGLTSLTTSQELIEKIRQYDKNSSMQLLENQIDTLYETKDDTDIVVLDNNEYWIAPKSFWGGADAFEAAYNRHVIFTHTEGFLAMDAHDGFVVSNASYTSVFGVNSTYPIYFGEGYRNDIILNVPGYTELNNISYPSAADGTLSGILAWWKLVGLSFDFFPLAIEAANGKETSFLRRTNIFDRVGSMLLPYMYYDEDPYMVFDKAHSRLYYSVPIYISLPGFSYYQTNYRRFLGWVLVDVLSGVMTFYQSPGLDKDGLISFAKVYIDNDIYPWLEANAIPEWLQKQLRYPENFFERQLRTDYTYHVQEWQTWKQRSDLFDRPTDGDLYYILMDLGEGLEFVAVDLVQPAYGTTTLAGMYLIRQSHNHFGETRFYRIPSSRPFVGPNAAEQSFAGFPGVSQQLTLIGTYRYGNVLLYPYANSLYYMIPVYKTLTDGLQQLNLVGLVNGFNTSEVIVAPTARAAFEILKLRYPQPGQYETTDIEFQSSFSSAVVKPDNAEISFTLTNTITNFSWPPVDVTVNLTVYSQDTTLYFNGTTPFPSVQYMDGDVLATNYTIGNWLLHPSQIEGQTIELSIDMLNFAMREVEFKFVLSVGNDSVLEEPVERITFYSASYSVTNITGSDVMLSYSLPASVTEPELGYFLLNVTNLFTNTQHVQVNLTVFSTAATVTVPGLSSIPNSTFTSDPMYPGVNGITYTVIDRYLDPTVLTGITVALGLNPTQDVELVYRLDLIVDGALEATTELLVITWIAA